MPAMIVVNVVQQHADDAVALAAARRALIRAPHVNLQRLRLADERLQAHLMGLELAAEESPAFVDAMLESPSAGVMFTAGVGALERMDELRLERLVALAQAVPEGRAGLLAAFGWVGRARLQGIVARLLGDADPCKRLIGVAVCAMHRVDPAIVPRRRLHDPDPAVRGRTLRAAGELGLRELVSSCGAASRDPDADLGFWAAWSATLLGDRHAALDALTEHAGSAGPHAGRAFRLALQAATPSAAHRRLQALAAEPGNLRRLIEGSGVVGDPAYVPWLIQHMDDTATARLAGEAFTLVTGVDLGMQGLDRPAPEHFESGPSDDPDDPNVEPDPDEDLPWPDRQKVEQWWSDNAGRFQEGQRYFMGAEVTRAHCLDVLRNGCQRQRILAAYYLCLLDPGTPLFNTSAPAWRQQRLLAQME